MPNSASEELNALIDSREMARLLNIHPWTLNRWARDGRIPYRILPNGRRRYHPDDVRAAMRTSHPEAS